MATRRPREAESARFHAALATYRRAFGAAHLPHCFAYSAAQPAALAGLQEAAVRRGSPLRPAEQAAAGLPLPVPWDVGVT